MPVHRLRNLAHVIVYEQKNALNDRMHYEIEYQIYLQLFGNGLKTNNKKKIKTKHFKGVSERTFELMDIGIIKGLYIDDVRYLLKEK